MFVRPPGGEIQTFPGAVLGLCLCFPPLTFCLTAPSSPYPMGLSPPPRWCPRGEALRRPHAAPQGHFLCLHPKIRHSTLRRVCGGGKKKKSSENSICWVLEKFCEMHLLSCPPFMPPAFCILPWVQATGLLNQQDHAMDPKSPLPCLPPSNCLLGTQFLSLLFAEEDLALSFPLAVQKSQIPNDRYAF